MKTKKVIFWGVILFLSLVALFGCKTQTKVVEIPVETVKTQYVNKVSIDSVYLRDSIYIFSKNDTVYSNKFTYLYKNKFKTDTLYRDVLKEVPVKVELPPKEIPYYPKWLLILSGLGLLAIGYLGFRIYRLFT